MAVASERYIPQPPSPQMVIEILSSIVGAQSSLCVVGELMKARGHSEGSTTAGIIEVTKYKVMRSREVIQVPEVRIARPRDEDKVRESEKKKCR